MSITIQGMEGRDQISQENLLLDAVNRVGRARFGWIAVHIHLSQLRSEHKRDSHIRIALRMFDALVGTYRSQIFLLSNSDVMVLVKDVRLADLDAIVFKLRALFSEDPLTFDDPADGVDRFCTYYDLSRDFGPFFDLCAYLSTQAETRSASGAATGPLPLTPKTLSEVVTAVSTTNIAPFVRRQAVVGVLGGAARICFEEFFVSIGDLRSSVAPQYDLTADRWLFQHLSQTLDTRMLAHLEQSMRFGMPKEISMNLNVMTVLTPAFQEFMDRTKGMLDITVEVQLADVFADFNSYFAARDKLRDAGHKMLLDGISYLGLEFSEPQLFEADMVKIIWSPALADLQKEDRVRQIKDTVLTVGSEKVILARCESDKALRWGLSLGVGMFQGHFVDSHLHAGVGR